MYHYYVRFSIFIGGEKVGDRASEATTEKRISEFSQIEQLKEDLKEEVVQLYNCEVDDIIIDFYQLLRKDSE